MASKRKRQRFKIDPLVNRKPVKAVENWSIDEWQHFKPTADVEWVTDLIKTRSSEGTNRPL